MLNLKVKRPVQAMELLIDKLNKTKSNAEFLAAM
jgi:transcription termination factor Rho